MTSTDGTTPAGRSWTIRPAGPDDVPAIQRMVHDLAEYEREPDAVESTEDHVRAALFPDEGAPTTFAHLAEVDGEVVGMAVWFLTYSTWTGRNGIWLEDLWVDPQHRGGGLGKGLLAALAQVCRERDYRRLEWWVLNWNTPSIAFYESIGAVPQSEWTTYRLDGQPLTALAEG
ncbi:GNAT family N-acetyltransferase [Phycicoccus sp. BSK3Z-2]|uniref:GNAT family N-acetyltransferase n=1 Tax=Phycicoccus avicenniae TaxID=2828860 RepID=A0A941I032_9MICO|nr:GNAT family N-acetyltransferase [Phycicoccus avicenniae]MBR7744758.1 GNAT family N-acetyltransferase [Phycicoccus avicenniae]